MTITPVPLDLTKTFRRFESTPQAMRKDRVMSDDHKPDFVQQAVAGCLLFMIGVLMIMAGGCTALVLMGTVL